MTTENVTVLFTDMVGSTALASALTPDGADEARRAHFSVLRQAVVEAGGAEVKNLGDGLMVVFATASAALSCAVGMQQGIELDNRAREGSVGLRVGLSGGEVTREEKDYFGDPVVEAARLCASCDGGQILAAETVRLMAGRRSKHHYVDVGPLELKGLPGPVDAVEVCWDPLDAAATNSVPLPGRLNVRPAAGVVGRDGETATISDAFKRVVAGEGREVVLVSGEPGIGKTALVAQAARDAFDRGACVLLGHCEEDLAIPYQLFAEALGHYVTHAPEDALVAHVDSHGSQLARLVPNLASRLPALPPLTPTDADTERYLLFAAVVGLLAERSREQPVVLVLDDLQWADKASLQLLRHVIAADEPTRVLVLGTYRESELSHSHLFLETLAALHRQSGVARLELSGLDGAGVIAFLEAAAGHDLDDAAANLAGALHRETDGNPFFVGEVLRHLSETGAIYQDANARWVVPDGLNATALPDSVREVIGVRVGRLGPDAGRVLSVAAVLGRDFDVAVLARAAEMTDDELLDILDAAAGVTLVRELGDTPGHYCFAHALIQRTLYEDSGVTRRALAHRRIALALEELYGDQPGTRVGELAYHWVNAPKPIDVVKAADYSRRAADAALRALAPGEAARYYAQALSLLAPLADGDPTLAIDLAIGLGTAQRQAGDPAFRETLLGAARAALGVGDSHRLVAAVLANDRGWHSAVGIVDAERVEMLEAALDHVGTEQTDRALLLAALCSELTWGGAIDRREALADEAIAIAQGSGNDAVIVRVLNHTSYPLAVPPLLDQLLTRTADAMARAERLGDPALRFWSALWREFALQCAGNLDEGDRYAEIADRLAVQLNEPGMRWVNSVATTVRVMITGANDRLQALAAESLRIGTDGNQPDAFTYYGTHLATVAWQRGDMGDLVALIGQLADDNPGLVAVPATLAVALVEADRTDDALGLLEAFSAAGFDLPLDTLWLGGMVLYAEAAIECGDPTYAGPLFERLAPWADRLSTNGGGSSEGPVSHYLGGLATLLGRYDDADAYFEQANAFNERVAAKFFAARTHLSWGRMLAARGANGDHEKARARLNQAQAGAAANGYANVERRATAALRALG